MKPFAPLVPVETSSWSAQAFAIVQQREAVRQLEADFDRELEATIYDRAMALARGLTDDCTECGGEFNLPFRCLSCNGSGTVRRETDDEPTKVERKAITPGDDMP